MTIHQEYFFLNDNYYCGSISTSLNYSFGALRRLLPPSRSIPHKIPRRWYKGKTSGIHLGEN